MDSDDRMDKSIEAEFALRRRRVEFDDHEANPTLSRKRVSAMHATVRTHGGRKGTGLLFGAIIRNADHTLMLRGIVVCLKNSFARRCFPFVLFDKKMNNTH